jgi:putative addiction module CopG family antidote
MTPHALKIHSECQPDPRTDRVIADKIKTGHYRSASEVVRAALRLLDERDRREVRPAGTPLKVGAMHGKSTTPGADLFQGGGEMGALIRSHDWAATSLGPITGWPQSLKTAVGIMLSTRHPVFIFWGQELHCFYNDAYAASLGPEKHPSILGCLHPGVARSLSPCGTGLRQVMAGGDVEGEQPRSD